MNLMDASLEFSNYFDPGYQPSQLFQEELCAKTISLVERELQDKDEIFRKKK